MEKVNRARQASSAEQPAGHTPPAGDDSALFGRRHGVRQVHSRPTPRYPSDTPATRTSPDNRAPVKIGVKDSVEELVHRTEQLLALVDRARAVGMRERRAQSFRSRLYLADFDGGELDRIGRRLRNWVLKREKWDDP